MLTRLSPEKRAALLASLPDDVVRVLLYDWELWARDKQIPPAGEWSTWLILAGRGYGKTRTGAEWVRHLAEHRVCEHIAMVGRTPSAVRDVMIEGESGILAISPPWFRPVWKPTVRRLIWPNGVIATTYSAHEPDELRGPAHGGAWCDEIATWQYMEAWDNLLLGLRSGQEPQVVVTTTPKPLPLIKSIIADPMTHVTRGTTYENLSNLAPVFKRNILAKYEGTRLGRQELLAELLEDVPGALWTRLMLEDGRVRQSAPLQRIAVGVDPAASSQSDTGIIVSALGLDGHGYALADYTVAGSPETWGQKVLDAYLEFGANLVVGEVNNGGEMVGFVVNSAAQKRGVVVGYKAVRAAVGKFARAEPVAQLYEQKRIHHVGSLGSLEDQLCSWVPGEGLPSPDRLDALVWGMTELMLGHEPEQEVVVADTEPVRISPF